MSKRIYFAIMFIFFLSLSGYCYAASITLHCIVDGAAKGVDYVIDIEKRSVTSPTERYKTVQIDKDYVTASTLAYPVLPGGEIWVLDRNSGEFKYVWVGLSGDGRLFTFSNGGKCIKKLL